MPRLLGLRMQINGLTVSHPFNAEQHVLLTAVAAAIVAFHVRLTDLNWPSLHVVKAQNTRYRHVL